MIATIIGATLFLTLVLVLAGYFLLREKPELIQEVAAPIRREPAPRSKVRAAFDVIEDATKDLVAHDFFRTIATEEADQKFATIGKAFEKRQAKTRRRSPAPSPPKDDAGLFTQ